MRIGLNLGYWASSEDVAGLALARAADQLGWDSVWTSEAYGSDAVSVLGAIAATTKRIGIGSAVMQVPGRSAANTGMTAATLDVLSRGRMRLGLGVSGPQVSEGWHGVRFDKPGTRLREYVEIVRLVLSGQKVEYSGDALSLPLPDGPGIPLRLTIKPVQQQIPIYLATLGAKNMELTGTIANGWLGVLVSPENAESVLAPLKAGLANNPARDSFDILTSVPTIVGDDVAACRDAVRPWLALYVGGMGSREVNFYYRLAVDMGFAAAADTIQDAYLSGDRRAAVAAVPDDLVDQTCLIGDASRIRARMREYAQIGIGTLAIAPQVRDEAAATLLMTTITSIAADEGWLA